jgi:hypothetical protein
VHLVLTDTEQAAWQEIVSQYHLALQMTYLHFPYDQNFRQDEVVSFVPSMLHFLQFE